MSLGLEVEAGYFESEASVAEKQVNMSLNLVMDQDFFTFAKLDYVEGWIFPAFLHEYFIHYDMNFYILSEKEKTFSDP